MRFGERVREIERDDRLDPAVSQLKRLAGLVPAGPVRDVLHGVQIGHPLHPPMVQISLGALLSATVLDLLPSDHRRSAHVLVDIGLLTALPGALSGAVDWSEQHERQQRVGVVHAVSNSVGLVLYGASSLARARGRHGLGRILGLVGFSALGLGGALGGHIAYYRAGGANSADHLVDLLPEGWHDVGPLSGFDEGEPASATPDGVPVVVVRTGDSVSAAIGTCTHMGAPLAEGTVSDGCLRCPWHGSEFRLDDGSVVHGPATAGLETLEASVVDGRVRVRTRAADS